MIRDATPEDSSQIAAVWEAAWRDGHIGHIPDVLLAERTTESFRTRASGMIDRTRVAELDGVIVGFVTLDHDELEQLFVDRWVRGEGVASALLTDGAQRLLAAGHAQPWLAVVAGNARARRFYEREGWRDAGTIDYEAEVAGGTVIIDCHRYELVETGRERTE